MSDNSNRARVVAVKSVLMAGVAMAASSYATVAWSQEAVPAPSAQTVEPPAQTAQPQENASQDFGLEDIIVTARKQNESIMSVPVAATAINGTDLAANRMNDVASLSTLAPSVNFDKTSMAGGSLSIRGIGSSVFDVGTEQAVSTVIDGVQTSRGNFIQSGLFDLDRVEILKGPQALFFGKNSPGGVLSLNSKGPTSIFEAYVKGSYEFRTDEKILEGAISGPLTDTVRARIAARGIDNGGWIRNSARSIANPFAAVPGYPAVIVAPSYKKNDSKDFIARGTIDYKPTSNFTATLRGMINLQENRGNYADTETTSCGGASKPTTFGIVDPFGDCKIDNRQSIGPVSPNVAASDDRFRDGKPYGRYKAYLTSLTLDYSAGPIDITAVTGYLQFRYTRLLPGPSVYAFSQLIQEEKYHQFSQEVRFVSHYDGPLNISGGVYYDNFNIKSDGPNALFAAPADPATGSFLSYIYKSESKNKSYSAFGQVRWEIIDSVELSGGVRYSYDVRRGVSFNSFVNRFLQTPFFVTPGDNPFFFPQAPAGVVFSGSRKYNNYSPELTLSWTPVQNTLLYGSYKTGYKAGAVASSSILPASFSTANLFYRPERIKGFELGTKTQLLDNRLRLTASAFNYKYTDLQVSNFDSVNFIIEALNVGGLRTKGFEVDATYRATPELTLRAAAGYARARYTSFPGISCATVQNPRVTCDPATQTQDLAGLQKFRAPDWTGTVSFVYQKPISDDYILGFNGLMRFSSGYYTQEDANPFSFQKSYQVYDAGLRLRREDNRWELAVIGKNLSNKRYSISSLSASNGGPGTIQSTVNRPRQVAVEATFRY